MAAKRRRNSGEPADTQSPARKVRHDILKSDETAGIQTEMGQSAKGSSGSTLKGMSQEFWGEKLMSFYPAAVIEAMVEFEAGKQAASTPVISAASSPSVYVVTCLVPGEDIEAIQQYTTVDQANRRAMAEFADKCHFLAEITDESWSRGLGWPGKPYSAIWDLDPDGCWMAVGQKESDEDCTTVSVAKKSPRDRPLMDNIAADRGAKQDEAIDSFLRLWMAKNCIYIGDTDAENKLTEDGSSEDE